MHFLLEKSGREYRGNVFNIAVVISEANDIRGHQPEEGGLITDIGVVYTKE